MSHNSKRQDCRIDLRFSPFLIFKIYSFITHSCRAMLHAGDTQLNKAYSPPLGVLSQVRDKQFQWAWTVRSQGRLLSGRGLELEIREEGALWAEEPACPRVHRQTSFNLILITKAIFFHFFTPVLSI